MQKRLFKIGFVSNVLEWYDFAVFGYMAVIIGQLFFSSSSTAVALIKALFVFSISYLVRPLGSIFFGWVADKSSRKKAMQASLIWMAIPTFILALLPTYHSSGIAATVALIVLRLIQGFAAGGELPGSACYMYESAPRKRRYFYCSFVGASSMLGVLCGSLVTTILYWAFTKPVILDWAWRIPFLFGFLISIAIFYIRRDIVEPAAAETHPKTVKPARPLLPVIRIMALNAFISVTFYLLFVWMPSYLHVFLNISPQQSFLTSSVSLFALIVFTLLFGYYAERFGQKRLAMISIIFVMLAAYPLFIFLKTSTFALLLLVQVFFAFGFSPIQSVNMHIMPNSFNRSFRSRGVSIGFTFATAIFGGTAPTICSYLIHKTGSDFAPIAFLIVTALIALPAAFTIRTVD